MTSPKRRTASSPSSTRDTNIEGELRRLSIGGAGLFALLIASLVLVLESLGGQLTAFEDDIVPTERAVGSLLDSMGDIYARETAVLTASDSDAVVALGDDAAAETVAKDALGVLGGTVDDEQLESLSGGVDAFLASAADLTAAVVESHDVNAAFGAQLKKTQADIGQLLGSISALEGEIQLRYILLLRELDSTQSADATHRLVHGNVRMIEERMGAARTMIEILGRRIEQVALTHNRDELNSLTSNELAQASASAKASIDQLHKSLSSGEEVELAARVATVNKQLDRTVDHLTASAGSAGLIDLRHAFFDAKATMLAAQAAGRECSLTANTTLAAVGEDVREMAAATQKKVDKVVATTRFGVGALVLIGLCAIAFSARRLLAALRALRQQNADLAALKDELSEANTHLEARVAARTEELAAREASTRLLLNSMGDGIFEADSEGCLLGERSKAMDDWFGDRLEAQGPRVWNVLTDDPNAEASLQFGWDQLVDGFLPFDVAADQLPRRFERDGRVFDVEYRQGAQEDSVLVVVRDWTANEAAERSERESREFQVLVGNLLKDRQGFELTRDECEQLVHTLEKAVELDETKRVLHTLKGNTASFGFSSVAETCHTLESRIADEEELPSADHIQHVREEWEAALERLSGFTGAEEESDSLEIHPHEIDQLCRFVSEARSNEEILELIAGWNLTPAKSYLTRLERQARRIAAGLAKEVEITVRDNNIRVSDALNELWPSMIHLVRNSMDHGLESNADREAAGKDPIGKLYLTVEPMGDGQGLAIEIADDGAGINEALLRERLGEAAEGLSLLEVLSHDGLSSKDEVTDISGRGVGMSAVVSVVEELGGTVDVITTQGKGTSFRIEFPQGYTAPMEELVAA